ncbi:LysR family transcriptional regulator [Clavibacter michiganensis]|uniref:LysR family transcriptional regulator n=1 Tax=Clavibacter michiganensis TaxID=28447 RepID=UPI001BE04D85|nr:LysR substrate-binding domain-containing protein [Clavibacter michiganensis]MBT1636408.1 LysR family transcriptional regulator [Clavibacter michiganensis]
MDADPTALRRFAAVADELHFARAAKALNVSRIAVSRSILDLEALWGVELFVRDDGPTRLSPDGEARLVEARAAIAADDARLAAEAAAPPRGLVVAIVPGVTVAKWTRAWDERVPDVPLRVVPLAEPDAAPGLVDGSVDVAFLRLPVDGRGLTVVPLYGEVQVAILPKEHAHATADAVSLTDLAEDLLLQPADEVPGWPGRTAGADPVPMPADVAAAVELVAAGVGFVVVPHALGRLHARKDVVAVPVHDLPETRIAVAWREGDASPHIEELVGIVRGRTAASSRSAREDDERDRRKPTAAQKTARKAAGKPGGAGAKGGGKPAPKGGSGGGRTPPRGGRRGR